MASLRTLSSASTAIQDGNSPELSTAQTTRNIEEQQDTTNALRPYFVLVEDSISTEAIHPNVHYIFSDDDPEMLTAATLNASDPASTFTADHEDDIDHRILIVDMAADAKTIKKVSSLSPHWQVTTTEVSHAPSWHGSADSSEKNVLLKLSGASANTTSSAGISNDITLPDLVAMLDHELESLEVHMATWDQGTSQDVDPTEQSAPEPLGDTQAHSAVPS